MATRTKSKSKAGVPAEAATAGVSLRVRAAADDLVTIDDPAGEPAFAVDPMLAAGVEEVLAGLLGKSPRKARAAASEARSKVATALSLLDDSIEVADAALEAPAVAAPAVAAAEPAAEPVIRPNGQAYRPRMLAGRPDVEVLRTMREQGLNVMLSGAPGCGKTALLEAAFGADLVTFAGHGDAVVDELVGSWRPVPGGGYEWTDGPLVVAMEQGLPLFIDDATLTPSTVLARLYPAMDGRGEIVLREQDPNRVVRAKAGFVVVAAHNPGVPGAVLSEALASRFNLTVEVGTDYALAMELGVEARIVRAAAHLDQLRRDEQVSWAPQLRELLAYKRVADILGADAAVGNLLAQAPVEERELLASRLTWAADTAPLSLGARA